MAQKITKGEVLLIFNLPQMTGRREEVWISHVPFFPTAAALYLLLLLFITLSGSPERAAFILLAQWTRTSLMNIGRVTRWLRLWVVIEGRD